jgi:hypothetical protein
MPSPVVLSIDLEVESTDVEATIGQPSVAGTVSATSVRASVSTPTITAIVRSS